MTDLEARLEQALKADDPAPRDPMFRIEIMLRRERAVFRRRLLVGVAMALGAAILAMLGLGAAGQLAGVPRLAMIAAVGVVLTAFLAAAYASARPALRTAAASWRATALPTLRSTPRPRLWY